MILCGFVSDCSNNNTTQPGLASGPNLRSNLLGFTFLLGFPHISLGKSNKKRLLSCQISLLPRKL